VGETEGAPTPDNQEAEAQVVQDVVVVPSPQKQAPVEGQASESLVAQALPSSIPTRQFSTRSTRGVAPQERVTYQVRGQPTARSTRGMATQEMVTYKVRGQPTVYCLSKCFNYMIQGLDACNNQREQMQKEFLAEPRILLKEDEMKLQLHCDKSTILRRVWKAKNEGAIELAELTTEAYRTQGLFCNRLEYQYDELISRYMNWVNGGRDVKDKEHSPDIESS